MADSPPMCTPDSRQSDPPESRVLRLIDASLNRAAEGARVVEDYTRFVLDDRLLTECVKRLRHGIADAGRGFPWENRLAARDTAQDVGADVTLPSEVTRQTSLDVAIASLERIQQALRSLEEHTKTYSAEAASRFERLRYDTYCVAKSVAAGHRGRAELKSSSLYVLIEGGSDENEFGRRAEALCEAGVDVLQIRDKQLTDRELLSRARRLVAVTQKTPTLAIVNDRADIARLAHADGVHVGQDELSVGEARTILGADALIGVSTHSAEQLSVAIADGANYVGLGPTFPSTTKSFEDFPGLAYLRHAADSTSLPAFAIGGITEENLDDVLATGICRIAVASAVAEADDPEAVVRRLRKRIDATGAPHQTATL